MKKGIVLVLAIVLSLLALTSCGGGSESETASKLSDDYGLSSGFHAQKNDKWLVVSTSESAANDPKAWALDYYKEYGGDVDVIWVINFANHTTTQIRNDSNDGIMLHVIQMDGSDDVESSLNQGQAYSGTTLSEYYLYADDDGKVQVEDLSE